MVDTTERSENLLSLTPKTAVFGNSSVSLLVVVVNKGLCVAQVPLLQHYHPSVVLHAEQLLAGQPISAAADLEQHSLNHFLDRFVYREVKKTIPTKGSSMMQSGVPGQDGTGRIVLKKGPARGEDSMVNSEGFRSKDTADIPVDQVCHFALDRRAHR